MNLSAKKIINGGEERRCFQHMDSNGKSTVITFPDYRRISVGLVLHKE